MAINLHGKLLGLCLFQNLFGGRLFFVNPIFTIALIPSKLGAVVLKSKDIEFVPN